MHGLILESIDKSIENLEASEELGDRIGAEIEEFEIMLEENGAKCRAAFEEESPELYSIMNFAVYTNAKLVMATRSRNSDLLPLIWNGDRGDESSFVVLNSLATNVSNYSFSVFRELKAGSDLAAKSIHRSFLELVECLALVAYDEKFFNDYISEPDDIELFGKHWSKKNRPKIARSGLVECVRASAVWGEDWADWMKKALGDSYSFLSNFAHVSYAVQAVLAASDVSGWFGAHSSVVEATVRHHVLATLCLHCSLVDALTNEHKWDSEHEETKNYINVVKAFAQIVDDSRGILFASK